MKTEHFKQLRCWQLADQLRTEVIAICLTSAVKRDDKFCKDFMAAAGSVCSNISEGFGRFADAEIVRFFNWALGSLAEVQDDLIECKTRKVLDEARFDTLWDLSEHTKATTLKFKRTREARLASRRRSSRRT